jgi:Coenzyme PQQ synthesis protein D (PqqD)
VTPPVITRNPDVLHQEVEGELVLLDLGTDTTFALNEVGARFWELLGEHDDLDAVVAALLEEFDVHEATLRADLEALVEELRADGLVIGADRPA